MNFRTWLFAGSMLMAGAVLAHAQESASPAPAPTALKGDLVGNDGKAIGTVAVTGTDRVTIVRLVVEPGPAVTPGWHGIHFHAVGDCSDTEKFLASKGHADHGGKAHGLLNPEGPHEGDLPNIHAASDGSVAAELTTPAGLVGTNGLLDSDGFALVLHASPDDHVSQPIGGAGARVACAAFKR